jgi:hypothetical protein
MELTIEMPVKVNYPSMSGNYLYGHIVAEIGGTFVVRTPGMSCINMGFVWVKPIVEKEDVEKLEYWKNQPEAKPYFTALTEEQCKYILDRTRELGHDKAFVGNYSYDGWLRLN